MAVEASVATIVSDLRKDMNILDSCQILINCANDFDLFKHAKI